MAHTIKNKWLKAGLLLSLILAVSTGLLFWYAAAQVGKCADRVYDRTDDVPVREYGLLLGTSRIVQGKYLNQYYQKRMVAAAELYHAGKIKKIIVSGDNRRQNYNEPEDMRRSLLALGVSEADILPDYAGFRTLDSVVRARNVFGIKSFTVISQKFHCERAIYLARAHGLDAVGYAAAEVSPRFRVKRLLREPAACLVAVLDVNVWHRKPYFER